MPTIKVVQKTTEDSPNTYKKLKKYCDTKLVLKELGGMKPEVEWDDKDRMGRFDEKGVKGVISVDTKKPCTITVTMEIPFLMIPFKGLIATSIQNHLETFA